jgi:hypothetical protein
LLHTQFNDALKDIFTKQTRLKPVKTNGDLKIEGENSILRFNANVYWNRWLLAPKPD